MKPLLISLLLIISSFAATVTFEPTESKSYRDNPNSNTSLYVTVICVDGYKFIATTSGTGALSFVQMFQAVYNSTLPIKCSQDSK